MIDRLGVVLAGGRSTRFGSDKFLYTYDGIEMGLRAIQCLQPVVDRVVVAGRHDLPDSWDADFVYGENEGSGPLGAILDAYRYCPASRVSVVPCDMPHFTSSAMEQLNRGCDTTKVVGAFASSATLVEPQWLAGCWCGDRLRGDVEEMFSRGVRSVREVARRLPYSLVDLPANELFNLNNLVI